MQKCFLLNNESLTVNERPKQAREENHKALIYFRRCLQLNPENEPANCYVGMILQKQGRYNESLAAYRKAISLRSELKELESENARLKKMYAKERLRADILKEVLEKSKESHLLSLRWLK